MTRWMIIGVGNDLRGDDAVGCIAARKLSSLNIPGVAVEEVQGDCTVLLDLFAAAERCILIDAVVVEGGLPGTVKRFDLKSTPTSDIPLKPSSHMFGILEALAFANLSGAVPQRCILYGVLSSAFEFGSPMSPSVEAAIPHIVQNIVKEIENDDNA